MKISKGSEKKIEGQALSKINLMHLFWCIYCVIFLGSTFQKLKNDSSTVQCHYCALATFSEVVDQQMTVNLEFFYYNA